MTPAAVATVLVVLGGVAGVGWMLWPMLQADPKSNPKSNPKSDPKSDPDENPEDAEDPDGPGPEASPGVERIRALLDRGVADDDVPRAWTDWQPMLPDEPRRLAMDLAPAERLPLLHTANDPSNAHVLLVPIASAVLEIATEVDEFPSVLRGRRQGRAFHAVGLSDSGVYFDLVEALRVLPVIAIELEARGIDVSEGIPIVLEDAASAETLTEGGTVDAVAPWLAGMDSRRVMPEGGGVRGWMFHLRDAQSAPLGTFQLVASVREVGEGIAADHLPWAAVGVWTPADGDRVVESGATDPSVLEALLEAWDGESPGTAGSIRAESLKTWAWSGLELAELAAVGHYLTEEGIDVLRLVEDAFADGTLPRPDLHDEAQSLTAAAVLNWAAVVHRRAGYPNRAIGLLDAALQACAPDDDDNRADIHYNRGYARLQTSMARAPEPVEPGDLHLAVFPELSGSDVEALEQARQDFVLAARLNPGDAHAWSQQAVIHQLRGEMSQASDAWLQAATRSRDEDVQRQLRDNAAALKGST